MTDIELLSKLTGICAITGFEDGATDMIEPLLSGTGAARVYRDVLGSVHAVFSPIGEIKRRILLDAHIDEIGLIVRDIAENGMLKFTQVGGIDQRILPAMRVTVHGKRDIFGVITSLPPHITNQSDYKKAVPMEDMFIDTGLSYDEIKKIISVGDAVSFHMPDGGLIGDRYLSKALDDRAGCLAIIKALKTLSGTLQNTELHAMFSTGEEFSLSGASAGAYASDADMCICVDVGHAETPDSKADDTFRLTGGVMIGVAPSLKKSMSDDLRALAEEIGMDYQVEVMGGSSGTNAWGIAIAGAGIPCALLSIPLRYMHTGAEVVSLSDVDSVARLLSEYVKKLDGEVEAHGAH